MMCLQIRSRHRWSPQSQRGLCGGVQVHPVRLAPAGHAVAAGTGGLHLEPQAALQPVEVHPARRAGSRSPASAIVRSFPCLRWIRGLLIS